MPESAIDTVMREEKFLEEYSDCASAAASLLKGAWTPNKKCNDDVREQQRKRRQEDKLDELVFQSATTYATEKELFSSCKITLLSSRRRFEIRVRRTNGDLEAIKEREDWLRPLKMQSDDGTSFLIIQEKQALPNPHGEGVVFDDPYYHTVDGKIVYDNPDGSFTIKDTGVKLRPVEGED